MEPDGQEVLLLLFVVLLVWAGELEDRRLLVEVEEEHHKLKTSQVVQEFWRALHDRCPILPYIPFTPVWSVLANFKRFVLNIFTFTIHPNTHS
jgi:hypothetical protein